MEEITLEKELQARIFVHKTAVLGGFVMNNYLDKLREDNKGVGLPDGILMERADKFSNRFMQDAMADGSFDDLYEVAWNKLLPMIPDNLKVL